MSEKTVITCDHCEVTVENTTKSRFTVMPVNAAYDMPTIDACSREHLGLALAKAFGLPIDTKAADLFVEHAKSEARRVFLETEAKRLEARVVELEKRSYMAVPNPISMMVDSWANPQKEWDAANGKTPGRFYHDTRRTIWANQGHSHIEWKDLTTREQEAEEYAANAVLLAFGNSPPGQTTQANTVEALRRVRDKLCNQPAFNLVFGMEYVTIAQLRKVFDDELAKLEAKPAGKAPECFLCGKGPHDHTMMVLESLPEQFEVKWCNGRRQNFGTEKPAWWDVPKSDHVHELKSCSFCDKQPPNTSAESGLPDSVLAAITLPTKPTKPLRERLEDLASYWEKGAASSSMSEGYRQASKDCAKELREVINDPQ